MALLYAWSSTGTPVAGPSWNAREPHGYTPKGAQSTQTVGRIKSMGDIAQGFNGQLDTYIAQGGAVEHGIASTANFLGVGKDVSAVWAKSWPHSCKN